MRFLQQTNWQTLIIMVLCGVGFYFVFDDLIDKENKAGPEEITRFVMEVVTEGMTDGDRNQAVEKTRGVIENRMIQSNIPGATVKRKGRNRILVEIPGSDEEEAIRIKAILTRPEQIEYRLMVYGPITR